MLYHVKMTLCHDAISMFAVIPGFLQVGLLVGISFCVPDSQDNTESEMCFTLVQSQSEAQLCLQFRAATMLLCIYPLNPHIPCERTLLL